MVKQAFVCGQSLGTHTPLLVGDNEEAVSGAAAVGLKGNTDGKRAPGGNSWVEINWEDLTKSGRRSKVGRAAESPSIVLPRPAHLLVLVCIAFPSGYPVLDQRQSWTKYLRWRV